MQKHTTTINEYYAGRNVFVTGATGFMGKALLEKLLRSCPDIGNIYILIRPKRGKGLQERLEKLRSDPLYERLKQEQAGVLERKVLAVQGDCMELDLGLSKADRLLLTSSVSVIFHVAASVRFDDPLRSAVLLNTRGTRELAQLALDTPQLSALVHVSTTYCNCVFGRNIREELYPPPADWRRVIHTAEMCDPATLDTLTDAYLGPYPNTYTFTKALGEHVIVDMCRTKIPVKICRPSIVVSTLHEPAPGWIDNFNGPVGLLVACGKGLMRCSYQNPDISSDYIPVDVVIKAIIVAGWELGLRQQKTEPEIMHVSSGYHKWVTIGEVIKMGRDFSRDIPLNNVVWVPKGFVTRCPLIAYLNIILFHLIPALMLDVGLKLYGHRPMLARLQARIYNASKQLRYFTLQEWHFRNDKILELEERIHEKDRKDWCYDFRHEDIAHFMKNCILGARRYLLHETDDSLPQAKVHYNRMWWVDKVAMFLFYSLLFWLCLQLNLIELISNKLSSLGTAIFSLDGA